MGERRRLGGGGPGGGRGGEKVRKKKEEKKRGGERGKIGNQEKGEKLNGGTLRRWKEKIGGGSSEAKPNFLRTYSTIQFNSVQYSTVTMLLRDQ